MKVRKPNTNIEIEINLRIDNGNLPEFILPSRRNQDPNVIECYVPIPEGNDTHMGPISVEGCLKGSLFIGSVDLLADGSFCQYTGIEARNKQGPEYTERRSVTFTTALSNPITGEYTPKNPPQKVNEGRLWFKTLGTTKENLKNLDLDDARYASAASRAGVGSLEVVVSLYPSKDAQYLHHYPSAWFGTWKNESRLVYRSGISPDHELDLMIDTSEINQKRSVNFRKRWTKGLRAGFKPFCKIIFYYRSQKALDGAGCVLRNAEFENLEPDDSHFELGNASPDTIFKDTRVPAAMMTSNTTTASDSVASSSSNTSRSQSTAADHADAVPRTKEKSQEPRQSKSLLGQSLPPQATVKGKLGQGSLFGSANHKPTPIAKAYAEREAGKAHSKSPAPQASSFMEQMRNFEQENQKRGSPQTATTKNPNEMVELDDEEERDQETAADDNKQGREAGKQMKQQTAVEDGDKSATIPAEDGDKDDNIFGDAGKQDGIPVADQDGGTNAWGFDDLPSFSAELEIEAHTTETPNNKKGQQPVIETLVKDAVSALTHPEAEPQELPPVISASDLERVPTFDTIRASFTADGVTRDALVAIFNAAGPYENVTLSRNEFGRRLAEMTTEDEATELLYLTDEFALPIKQNPTQFVNQSEVLVEKSGTDDTAQPTPRPAQEAIHAIKQEIDLTTDAPSLPYPTPPIQNLVAAAMRAPSPATTNTSGPKSKKRKTRATDDLPNDSPAKARKLEIDEQLAAAKAKLEAIKKANEEKKKAIEAAKLHKEEEKRIKKERKEQKRREREEQERKAAEEEAARLNALRETELAAMMEEIRQAEMDGDELEDDDAEEESENSDEESETSDEESDSEDGERVKVEMEE